MKLNKGETALCEQLRYNFTDATLLRRALTHKSVPKNSAPVDDNERLEFLGDAVLHLMLTTSLILENPSMSEGELTRARIAAERGECLTSLALHLHLNDLLVTNHGVCRETCDKGWQSMLEDAFEALVGAVYTDAGMETATSVFMPILADALRDACKRRGDASKDPRTRLQELLQGRGFQPPSYSYTRNVAHADLQFNAVVRTKEGRTACGHGRSKKAAAADAASKMLAQLG